MKQTPSARASGKGKKNIAAAQPEEEKARNAVWKTVRVFTVPPVGALAAIFIAYFSEKSYFGGVWNLVLAVVFLALLPLAGYAVWLFVPALKKGGRKTQRKCAIVAAFGGYVAGAAVSFCLSQPAQEKTLFLLYAFSGALIAALNACKIKASGHACGVAGPAIYLARIVNVKFLFSLLLLLPVYVSSVRLRRHTAAQLCIGTLVPAAAFFAAYALCF
ncbi:MAG: hypothetical protein ACI4SH_00785 [Candidatus Scatosoma sp.]